jgi:hypothetical protein
MKSALTREGLSKFGRSGVLKTKENQCSALMHTEADFTLSLPQTP